MKERTQNIAVGITSILGLCGVAAMLMMFGYLPSLANRGYSVRVTLPNAGGLTDGSRVLLSGIQVGRVVSVSFDEDNRGAVIALLRINNGVSVPRDGKARTVATLLGGMPSLEITAPPPPLKGAPTYLPTDGTGVIQGESTTLAGDIQHTLDRAELKFEGLADQFATISDRITKDLDDATHSFGSLSQAWTGVGQNVNQLLEPRSAEKVDLEHVAGNIATVVARTDQRLRELKGVLEGIDQWVHDPQLHNNVRQTAAGAAALAAKTGKAVDHLDELITRYVGAADELSATIRSARAMLDLAQHGDGTLAQLLHDPRLYNNLDDAAARIAQAVSEFKLLLEKTRKEGLPVKF